MAEEDDAQKTEEPTQRKIDEAIKRGQVIYSREITNFLMLFALALIISWILPNLSTKATYKLQHFIEHADIIAVDKASIGRLLFQIMLDYLGLVLLPIIFTICAALASSFLQNGGFLLTPESIAPKFSKISPLQGLKRLFSSKSLMEFVKGIFKIIIAALVSYLAIRSELDRFKLIHDYNLASMSIYLKDLVMDALIAICIMMAILAALDYLYQRYEFYKSLRMSKQDLKEEYKETEGSPEIKSKLRQLRQQKARQRMMQAVPQADVIITNPTHFSVALQYDIKTMKAPKVIAKGQDFIALKIREIAKKHDVPIYESPILARALYKKVEIDDEIPIDFYQSVAEIISYIYKLNGKLNERVKKDS